MFWFLPIIFGGLAVGLICAKIDEFLTKDSISETIKARDEFTKGLKAMVNDISTRNVRVGIYDRTEQIGEMEIESSKGVSNSLYEGQVIDLRY